MFKVLVDLNVVLDVLLDRPSLGPTSTQLLVLVDQKRLEGWPAAGIKAVIQPGGSIRDEEVVGAANEHGMAMVFTGVRHFKH